MRARNERELKGLPCIAKEIRTKMSNDLRVEREIKSVKLRKRCMVSWFAWK